MTELSWLTLVPSVALLLKCARSSLVPCPLLTWRDKGSGLMGIGPVAYCGGYLC